MAAFAGVGRPVEIDPGLIILKPARFPRGQHETRQFFGRFFLDSHQHQKRAQLYRQHLAGHDHFHGPIRFVPGQRPGTLPAFAQNADVFGERMFGPGSLQMMAEIHKVIMK